MDGEFYEQDVVCVSHNDLDGTAAAAVVKKKHPRARIFHCNYGREVPNAAFVKGSRMYITDFTLQQMEFKKAENILGHSNIFWIDHHSANFVPLQNMGISYAGIRKDDACGALLAWRFLFPSEPAPEAIKLVDDYDRWQFKDPRTKDFQAGISLFETRPGYRTCYIWNELLSDNKEIANHRLSVVIEIGKKIRAFTEIKNRLLCDDLTYVVDWQGQKMMIANMKHANSMFFDSHPEKKNVDAVSILQYSPDIKKYRCSVYSPDDVKIVLPIAQMFPGGGGHPKAAGFQSPDYPYPFPSQTKPESMETVIKRYHDTIFGAREDAIVNQCACRSDKITLTSSLFRVPFCKKPCLAVNHPYISELLNTFPSTVDVIDPESGQVAYALIGFVLTKYGYFRNGIRFTDKNPMSKDEFASKIVKLYPDAFDIYKEDLGAIGSVFWWYSKQRPVVPPSNSVG